MLIPRLGVKEEGPFVSPPRERSRESLRDTDSRTVAITRGCLRSRQASIGGEREMQGSSLELPTGYYVERDPDVLILRRLDGSMVGAFSARGAAPEAVLGAIEEAGPRAQTADREAPIPALRSALRAHFFGHFEMFCDDEVVPLGRNGKALAILKYLLAYRGRPVSQDHLMGWLWPESSPKKARWSLNSAVHVLRKLLSGCTSSATVNYILLEEGY